MFSISSFIHANRVYVIWIAFGFILYLLRSLFGLLFITYILCFLTSSVTHALRKKFHLNRKLIIVVLFSILLLLTAAFLRYIPPRLFAEAMNFTDQLPASVRTVKVWLDSQLGSNEVIAPILEHLRQSLTPETAAGKAWGIALGVLNRGVHYISWFFLAMLFSFLIMLDLPYLSRGVRHLRYTLVADILREVSNNIALFARVVGENFRAQLIVSAVNTTLTFIGLYVLGVKAVVLLCTIVFVCGLIPVLGVFISSVPVVLMAVNTGGVALGFWAVGLIIAIHLLEAYVLNPRIVSSVMHINPVMTILILYIAHSLMGMWGMLLGVPIAVYCYHKISMPERKAAAAPEGKAFSVRKNSRNKPLRIVHRRRKAPSAAAEKRSV